METDALTQLQIDCGVEIEDKIFHLLERWAKILDNAAYLVYEHRIKEKEDGIKWRQAFKTELKSEANIVSQASVLESVLALPAVRSTDSGLDSLEAPSGA